MTVKWKIESLVKDDSYSSFYSYMSFSQQKIFEKRTLACLRVGDFQTEINLSFGFGFDWN